MVNNDQETINNNSCEGNLHGLLRSCGSKGQLLDVHETNVPALPRNRGQCGREQGEYILMQYELESK